MPRKIWIDGSNRRNALELITWLLDHKQGPVWVMDDARIELALYELMASTDILVSEGNISRTFDAMWKEGRSTVEDFEGVYHEVKKRQAAKAHQSTVRWKFFVPFAVDTADDVALPLQFRLLGKTLWLRSLTSVQREIGKGFLDHRDIVLAHQIDPTLRTPTVFLVLSGDGETAVAAWVNLEVFDTFRGLTEYALGVHQWRLVGTPAPRRRIAFPRWVIGKKPGAPLDCLRFIRENHDPLRSLHRLTAAQVRKIQQLASSLRRIPELRSTRSVLVDCLRLYTQAMDARFNHDCFLGLWQLAEALTLSRNVQGKTKDVCKRLAWHSGKFGLPGSGLRETLKELARKRNDVAHRGLHHIDHREVNIMKSVCESALAWLGNNVSDLPTVDHLESFYRCRGLDQAKLAAAEGALQYVQKVRA